MLLSNVGWRETTPSAHSLRSHQWFLRLVAQGHISSKALEMFAGVSDFLGIFTAHLDESLKNKATLKNIATLLKIAIKFLGPISYLSSYIGFFSPRFACVVEKGDSDSAFVYKLVCQTTLQWFIFYLINLAFGRKTDDFSRLLPAHLVKEKPQF